MCIAQLYMVKYLKLWLDVATITSVTVSGTNKVEVKSKTREFLPCY